MTYKNMLVFTIGAIVSVVSTDTFAAAAKKQSVLQNGTTVRTKVEAKGLYNQECYDAYYGCMDQFCITENSNGGSCGCSDDSLKYEKDIEEIQKTMEEAERIGTIEVEKVKAGAQADIIFTGTREYDENGNLKSVDELQNANNKESRKTKLLSLWDDSFDDDEDVFGSSLDSIMDKTGSALYRAADEICMEQVPDTCEKDLTFLRQVYSRQITADCKAFENIVKTKRAEADNALKQANADVRTALKESFDAANKYDLGQCMVEFKKCMQTDDACGKDWINCVSVVAAENAQVKTVSTAKTKVVRTENVFDITQSTMDVLNSKRNICENVLSSCMAVRDQVWPSFLKEAAPTIKLAESKAESKFRQSCLTNISNCIQTACKDDIVGKGVETMDACLSRPDMARSFCKVEIDPCERMEPLIWGYVVDKLAAMRVDVCTQEVKDCFTDDTRCGSNFQNCIGMDYNYIHDICPLDKLVVCKANRPGFSMDDLDSMLMGLYLNVDNAALEQCEQLVDDRMMEVCGSTTDCNKFAADTTIGTGSIRSQKDGNTYRVTGMISFGSIKMGDASGRMIDNGDGSRTRLEPGQIGVQEYLAKVRDRNANVNNADGIITSIEEELNNIAGTINRTIEMIEQDPQIQFCVNGRNLSQITGKQESTTGRFPNLLNQVKMQIAVAALRQAQDNYNAKLNKEIAQATKDASADIAQYMCQKIAENGGAGMAASSAADTPLAPPYAISYDVGTGLTTEELTRGGSGVIESGGVQFKNSGYLGGSDFQGAGMTKQTTAIFSRETRTCHICSIVITQSCKTTGSSSWFHNSRNTSCDTNASDEKCEDIQM